MRPPEFWDHRTGKDAAVLLRTLLLPLGALYAAIGAAKLRRTMPTRVSAPVICVGNLTMGGTGKTPIVRRLRATLRALGVEAHTLSRGHGGKERGPLRVDPERHTHADVGDEPLLHALDGPAWIARNRVAGAQAAIAAGAQAVLLDDGFQNSALVKDFSLLVFDAALGPGNGCVVPAGPLREPLKQGLLRADMVVLMGADTPERPDWLTGFSGPIVHATLVPSAPPPPGPLFGFAGIGRPHKFFDGIRRVGGALVDGVAFPDHHVFTPDDLAMLERHAAAHNARLIATEKDFVRLPAAFRAQVTAFPVQAVFTDEKAVLAALAPILASSRP
ncbi:MAG TPA: tetraacyldisaccharide 4'-kinase [Caulobacterales bacterium]|nr:tetraacyldisaccharide 4'-kinase [Caulobacterales bacterium]